MATVSGSLPRSSQHRDARFVQGGAEIVVARHAAAAVAHDVDHREIDDLSVRSLEMLQRARIIVQRDRAGMGDAEGIDGIRQPEHVSGLGDLALDVVESEPLLQLAGGVVAELVIIGDQRMQPIDRGEFLGQRIGRRVVIRQRLGMPFRACLSRSQMPIWLSHPFGAPYQLARSPTSIVLVARIAGVHSTVWIFAIRAETISRAVW